MITHIFKNKVFKNGLIHPCDPNTIVKKLKIVIENNNSIPKYILCLH